MNVRPRRGLTGLKEDFTPEYDGEIHWTPFQGGSGQGIVVHCYVTHPQSQQRTKVNLFLDQRDVTDMLLICRDSAREARR